MKGWTRVPGATGAWIRADGARVWLATYQPGVWAKRGPYDRTGFAQSQMDGTARLFYTGEQALAWLDR